MSHARVFWESSLCVAHRAPRSLENHSSCPFTAAQGHPRLSSKSTLHPHSAAISLTPTSHSGGFCCSVFMIRSFGEAGVDELVLQIPCSEHRKEASRDPLKPSEKYICARCAQTWGRGAQLSVSKRSENHHPRTQDLPPTTVSSPAQRDALHPTSEHINSLAERSHGAGWP